MANYKRRRPRSQPTHGGKTGRTDWLKHWPKWWDVVFHARPRRRIETRLLRAVVTGRIDPDDTAWPIANHKPHIYYW